jgi:hypothetical protein
VCLNGILLPDAVEVEATSFQRQKYCGEPKDTISETRPHENGVALLIAGELPPPTPVANSASGKAWEHFLVDNPSEQEGEAHCEVRVRERGSTQREAARVKKDAQRQLLKRNLASRMSILIDPN